MNNVLKATLLCVSTLLATHLEAAPLEQSFMPELSTLQTAYSNDFVVLPKNPQIIPNPLLVPIFAECTILKIGQQEEAPISLKLLKGTGLINDIAFSAGESIVANVSVGENFQIIAHPGSQVALVNEGEFNLTAHCTGKLIM